MKQSGLTNNSIHDMYFHICNISLVLMLVQRNDIRHYCFYALQAHISYDETFYIQLNLEAMGKGSNITDQDTIYKTSIHMAQAAVGPKYKAKFGYANNWFIGAYGYVGYSYLGTTKAEGHDDYELSFGTDPAKNDMNGIDYGVAFDTGFGFSGFNIGYRYNLPLANVSLWDGVKGVHTSQNIYLAYYFSQD